MLCIQKALSRILVGLAIAGFCALYTLGYIPIGVVQIADNYIYDTRLKFRTPDGIDDRVVILDIDEKSLADSTLGRWPWSRDRMASLVNKLFDFYGIRILAFDVVFAEEDKSSGLDTLKTLSKTVFSDSPDFQSRLKSLNATLDYDKLFSDSLRGRPVVLGYYFSSNSDARKTGELPFPSLVADDFKGTHLSPPEWNGFGSNLARLVSSAAVSGHFNPIVDSDGVVRRVPTLVRYEGDYYESLSLAIARLDSALSSGDGSQTLRLPSVSLFPKAIDNDSFEPTVEGIRVGGKLVHTDTALNVLVPYRGGPKSYQYLSAVDIVNGKIPLEVLKNKIVIVGTTAPGLVDLRATPVSGIYPGVEVHANVTSSLISDDPSTTLKRYPANLDFYLFTTVTALGFLMAVALPFVSPLASAISTGVLILIVVGISQWLWSIGFVVPVAIYLILVFAIFAWNSAYGFFVESRQKRQFTALFGQYVPPELVSKMAEDPEKYSMDGRKAKLTVLFSDVAGFTSISEQLSPTDLAEYINEYLTSMSLIIRENGGTLDKYIGDAIMAFWGAPVDDPKHAERAARAALQMQTKVDDLNTVFSKRGWPRLRIGIGLSSGEMTVGDMGSQVRRAYTVMGDAVNLGSRLEGLTRMYGNKVLASDETFRMSQDAIRYREIDVVRVKGKDVPVKIYEPIAPNDDQQAEAAFVNEAEEWEKVLSAYRNQDWEDATACLHGLVAAFPNDGLYTAYLKKVSDLKGTGVGTRWDGVTNYDTK